MHRYNEECDAPSHAPITRLILTIGKGERNMVIVIFHYLLRTGTLRGQHQRRRDTKPDEAADVGAWASATQSLESLKRLWFSVLKPEDRTQTGP